MAHFDCAREGSGVSGHEEKMHNEEFEKKKKSWCNTSGVEYAKMTIESRIMSRATLYITVRSICCSKVKTVDAFDERVDPPVREGGEEGKDVYLGGNGTSD